MPIKKHNQTRTYIDMSPILFDQIEEVARRYKLPRTTLLRRLVLYAFTNHLESVLHTGEPAKWNNPLNKDTK